MVIETEDPALRPGLCICLSSIVSDEAALFQRRADEAAKVVGRATRGLSDWLPKLRQLAV